MNGADRELVRLATTIAVPDMRRRGSPYDGVVRALARRVAELSPEVAGPVGNRTLPVAELLVGPGKTALEPGEVLKGVTIPAPASAFSGAVALGSAYVRLDYRQAMEIAVVGVAALVALGGDGRVAGASLALTAVAPTCVLVPAVGEALAGREPSDGAIREAADLAADVARPIDDVRAPADYRRAMVPVIARRALSVALRRARGEGIAVPPQDRPPVAWCSAAGRWTDGSPA